MVIWEVNNTLPYLLLAIAALMFGLYNVFIKLSSEHIEPALGAVILQFVAMLVGLGLLFYMQRGGSQLHVSWRGVGLSILAGVAIGLVEILTFVIFSRGVPVAVGNPLIIGGSLVVTTGVGVIALKEILSPLQLAAVALIALGVGLLAFGALRSAAA